MLTRFDRGPLKRPTRRADTLIVEGYAARTHGPGDGLKYSWGEEYRDHLELQAIAKQMEGLPVTLGHPHGLLRDGARGKVVGRVDAAWLDGDRIGVRVSVTDAMAARAVETGTKELSLGYAVRVDVDGDGYQRGSEADHLAIVDSARCGGTCSLRTDERLDCASTCSCQIDRSHTSGEGGPMADTNPMAPEEQIRLLQTQLNDAKVRASQLEGDLQTRTDERDDLRGKLAIAERNAQEAQARLDSGLSAAETEQVKKIQGQLDEANAKIREIEGSIPGLVRDRAALNAKAVAIMGGDFRADAMDEDAVLDATNLRIDSKADIKQMSRIEKRARFNAFFDARAASAASTARVGAALAVRADNNTQTEIDPFDPLHNGVGQYASPHAAKKGA